MDRCYEMLEQVLFDILLCLPVMSLLRFKSVCKSWRSPIESPTFITLHLNRNIDKEDSIIIFHRHHIPNSRPSNKNEMVQLLMLSGKQHEDCVDLDFERLLWHPAKEVELIGSCNGILCLNHYMTPDFALWNPSLKQLRPLPQALFSGSKAEYFTAFGTDATNDFKVLRISLIYSGVPFFYGEQGAMIGNQAEVYSLRGNSWRITHKDDALLFTKNPSYFTESKCTGGKCFWITHDNDLSRVLLSFDFNDEMFGTMVLPDVDSGHRQYHHHLDSCNNKLVYIRAETGYKIYEIWMLHEYGVKESWE